MSDGYGESGSTRTKQLTGVVIVIVVLGLLAAAVAWWVLSANNDPMSVSLPVVPETPAVVTGPIERTPPVEAQPEPAPALDQTPAEPEPEPEPLPALNDSDPAMVSMAETLSPDGKLVKLLVPERSLLKLVRAVIAVDEGDVVKDHRPVVSPPPPFRVLPIDEPIDPDVGQRYRIDPANYDRYDNYVDTFAALDKQALATLYHRYYPLLDEAYKQYGVDRGGFLNVTLRALDRLAAVKIPDQDPILIQPKVFFQYQNPAIESLPAPDKLILRMGSENAAKFQASLKELRDALAKPR